MDDHGEMVGVEYKGLVLSVSCANSLHWLNDTLRDYVREDITVLIFHVWTFVLAIVTILNESLPHLVSGLAGHALVTGWAAFRVGNSRQMHDTYYSLILNGTCASSQGAGTDILGTEWWNLKKIHEVCRLRGFFSSGGNLHHRPTESRSRPLPLMLLHFC